MSYREFVQAQKRNNPCLAGLSNFLGVSDLDRRPCRILKVEFSTKNEIIPNFQHIDPEDLHEIIHPTGENGQPRILIVEDLRHDVIETLGSAYQIDPVFFASHLHAPFRQMDSQTPNLALLPSRQRKQNFVNFHYHRAVELKGNIETEKNLTRDMNVDRKIAVLLPTEKTRVAFVQHACSVILIQESKESRGWLCLILVDGPIPRDYIPVVYDCQPHQDHQQEKQASRISSRLFLDGYEDFMLPSPRPPDLEGSSWVPRLSRESILKGLAYYWKREIPEQFDMSKPTLFALSIYPLRIIAAEWNNYMAAMSHHLKRHEYAVEAFNQRVTELDKLDAELRSLQGWRRRSLASQQKIASIAHFLSLHTPQTKADSPLDEDTVGLQEDYAYLAMTLDDLSRRLKNMLPVVTSLVQISDSRRALAESANVSRLTSLAIVFAPLSFTTGLFSMDNLNGPGGAHFWVFFVVAIPITILVFLVARPPAFILRLLSTRARISQRKSQLQV